ncbi:MAG: winged helix-turn-helix transcriptional regulator [Inquilinus sp.]|nr:winged helix-turn-helix transcriptional regulator [Inquilinus sp.]
MLREARGCSCLGLRRAGRAVSRIYDSALQPAGLKGTQFSLLAVVANLSPTNPVEVAEMMAMDRTTLSRNLRPLVAAGLIALEPGEEDRRRRSVVLTAKGRATLEKAMPLWRQAQRRTEEAVGKGRMGRLREDLDRVVRGTGGS